MPFPARPVTDWHIAYEEFLSCAESLSSGDFINEVLCLSDDEDFLALDNREFCVHFLKKQLSDFNRRLRDTNTILLGDENYPKNANLDTDIEVISLICSIQGYFNFTNIRVGIRSLIQHFITKYQIVPDSSYNQYADVTVSRMLACFPTSVLKHFHAGVAKIVFNPAILDKNREAPTKALFSSFLYCLAQPMIEEYYPLFHVYCVNVQICIENVARQTPPRAPATTLKQFVDNHKDALKLRALTLEEKTKACLEFGIVKEVDTTMVRSEEVYNIMQEAENVMRSLRPEDDDLEASLTELKNMKAPI